jgi:hypothetical protein
MKMQEMGKQLLHAFASIKDPRSPHGQRHPLPAILTLATVAMLNGSRSLYAIARWGRLQPPGVVYALGFTRAKTPSASTLHEIFQVLDVRAFEAALIAWAQENVSYVEGPINHTVEVHGIHGETVPGVELVVNIQVKAGLVLE